MIIVVMGVAGAGKTTVGRALAEQLGWRFADADEFHSSANIAKMRAGTPLTDADRAPWLESLHLSIVQWLGEPANVVLAASLLKEAYRQRLPVSPRVKLVYLRAAYDTVVERVTQRQNSFLNPHLLPSQFETLEEPRDAVVVDAGLPVVEVVQNIRAQLGL